jgi:hypothetical protein
MFRLLVKSKGRIRIVVLVARGRFELPSAGPEPAMLDHYTTGLLSDSVRKTFQLPNKYLTVILITEEFYVSAQLMLHISEKIARFIY